MRHVATEEARRATGMAEDRELVEVLASGGMRISEALGMRGDDIGEGWCEVATLKRRGRPRRRIPIPGDLCLRMRARAGGDGRVFGYGRVKAWRIVREALARAGVEGGRANARGLRHGFAVAQVLGGVPLNVVQRWMGHANLATTSVYTDLADAEVRWRPVAPVEG